MHILVVDDDADIRRIAAIALERLGGLRVAVATSGEEALALAPDVKPDLILLDVSMPGMGGLAAFARLQSAPATARVPVVFFTATSNESEASRLMALGAAGVVAKPFELGELARCVHALLATGDDPEVDDLLAKARAAYAATLPSRVAHVMALATKSDWDEVRRAAHKLRGSAATYGFAELGVAVGQVEDAILEAHGAPDENTQVRIRAALGGAEAEARAAHGRGEADGAGGDR